MFSSILGCRDIGRDRTINIGGATRKQRDVYKKTREILDEAIAEIKVGASSADIAKKFPAAQEFGMANEEEAFGLATTVRESRRLLSAGRTPEALREVRQAIASVRSWF